MGVHTCIGDFLSQVMVNTNEPMSIGDPLSWNPLLILSNWSSGRGEPAGLGLVQSPSLCGRSRMFDAVKTTFTVLSLYGYRLAIDGFCLVNGGGGNCPRFLSEFTGHALRL